MGDVAPDQVLSKKQKIAMKIKENTPGLIYLKFFGNGRCEDGFEYNGQLFHNIVDIYALRRRLYTLKDVEKADFNTLLGQHFHEFNFAPPDEPRMYSNFDTGNLWRAYKGVDDIYYAQMTGDANSLGHQKYFHFAVSGLKKGVSYKFRVFNFSREVLAKQIYQKSKKLFKKKEIGWVPLTTGVRCFSNNHEQLDGCVKAIGKDKYTVEFECKPDFEDDVLTFSILPPYSYEDLVMDSNAWMVKAKSHPHFHMTKKLLCYTLMGRKMFYYEAYRSEEKLKLSAVKGKKVIAIMARVHPGECNSSFTIKGFLDEYLEDSYASKFLRENFFFVIIPMMNPDGVSIGHSRTSFAGQDLNQTWERPDRYLHPEIYYIKKILKRLAKENELVFSVDIHGNFIRKGVFVRGSGIPSSNGGPPEFARFLSALINDFDEQASFSNTGPERKENCHTILSSHLGFQNSWGLNCSTSGGLLFSAYSIYEYTKLGKDFVDALGRYLVKKYPKMKSNSELKRLADETWKGCMMDPSDLIPLRFSPPGSCRSIAAKDPEREGKYLMAFLRAHQRSLNRPIESAPSHVTPVEEKKDTQLPSAEKKTEPKPTEDDDDSVDLDQVPRLGAANTQSQNLLRPTTAFKRPESALRPLTRQGIETKEIIKSGSFSMKKLTGVLVRSDKVSTKKLFKEDPESLIGAALPETDDHPRKGDFKISKGRPTAKPFTQPSLSTALPGTSSAGTNTKEPTASQTPKSRPPRVPPVTSTKTKTNEVSVKPEATHSEQVRQYDRSLERQFREATGTSFPKATLVDLRLEPTALGRDNSKTKLGYVPGRLKGGPRSDRDGARSLGRISEGKFGAHRAVEADDRDARGSDGWGLPKATILGFDLSADANRTIDDESYRKKPQGYKPPASRSLKRRETVGPMPRRNSTAMGTETFYKEAPEIMQVQAWQPKPLGGRARPPKPSNKGSLPRAQRWGDSGAPQKPGRSRSKDSRGLGIEGFEIAGSKGKDKENLQDWGYAPSPVIKNDPQPLQPGDYMLRTVTMQMQQVAQRLESFHRMFSTPY